MLPCLLLLALLQHLQGSRQVPPPPVPPAPAGTVPAAPDPAPDPSIAALVPGAIPADARPEARAAWERVAAGSLVPGTARAPIRAFVLALDVRYRKTPTQTNDLDAVYRFLGPDHLRISTEKRDLVSGPGGDWLVDRARGEQIRLDVGREYAEDRRQIEETRNVARNFVALSDPRSLRLASLETLAAPPAALPEPLRARAAELSWLRVRSPDFRPIEAGGSARIHRASLGFDPHSGRVSIALVEEDASRAAPSPSARVVELRGSLEAQGYLVPRQILVYSIEPGSHPAAFSPAAGMDLYVKSADLAPALRPDEFAP